MIAVTAMSFGLFDWAGGGWKREDNGPFWIVSAESCAKDPSGPGTAGIVFLGDPAVRDAPASLLVNGGVMMGPYGSVPGSGGVEPGGTRPVPLVLISSKMMSVSWRAGGCKEAGSCQRTDTICSLSCFTHSSPSCFRSPVICREKVSSFDCGGLSGDMGEIERKITGLPCESSLVITVSIVSKSQGELSGT